MQNNGPLTSYRAFNNLSGQSVTITVVDHVVALVCEGRMRFVAPLDAVELAHLRNVLDDHMRKKNGQ